MENRLSQLTLEQKVLLTSGKGSWHTYAVGCPSVHMTDGPHGLRVQGDNVKNINDSLAATCFPTACSVASSWNVANAAHIGRGIAEEAISAGVDMVLGPGVNIKRSPLCGRNFEYFSEDPLLAGELASSYISSMQSMGIGSCVKHYAVNSQETRRMTIDAIVDERALREIYLAAFQRVIKNARPWAVMASYNKVNGQSATQNKHLIGILRNEWHFDGVVMSDWGASYDTAKAIEAGMDLEMPEDTSGYHRKRVLKAVQNGTLAEAALDAACTNIMRLTDRCSAPKLDFEPTHHREICKNVATDSAVLLKNDNATLPLSVTDDFCVIGELAEKPRYQGGGSSHINSKGKSFLQVLQENGHPAPYSAGYSVNSKQPDAAAEDAAVALAAQHQVVLFFGGLTDIAESEGYDRTTLDLPQNQLSLLQKLASLGKTIVFVAFGGSPFAMPWLNDVRALLNMYLGGQAVMDAAYDLLFGKVSPSGRLAETFPLNLSDTPCYNYFANDYNFDEHRESLFVGYRYYNSFNIPVLFPFGYGLSYAQFDYSDLQVLPAQHGFDVSVSVTNSSSRPASEVVQLYVDNPPARFIRPKRELRAFCKVFLQAGETRTVTFRLTHNDFAVYHNGFVAVNGDYQVTICKNVQEPLLSCPVTVSFGTDLDLDQTELTDYFAPPQGSFTVSDEQFHKLTNWQRPQLTAPKRGQYTLLNTFGDMQKDVGLVRTLLRTMDNVAKSNSPSKSLDDPVAQMLISGTRETPLVALMSVGGVKAKYIKFLLYHANKKHGKALKSLFGKYQID